MPDTDLTTNHMAINQSNLARWRWLLGVYLVLMLPVAATLVLISYSKGGEMLSLNTYRLAFYIFIMPAWAWAGYIGVWYVGAAICFLSWKYAEALQWLTGIPTGRWVGRSILRDRFLRNAPQRGPYGWLYRQVAERYPGEHLPS